jgi:flavodoxin
MKALLVYDSMYGNTERIAKAIGAALAGDVRVSRAGMVDPATLAGIDLP